jgi:hypothetical protein
VAAADENARPWPPAYDEETLEKTIRHARESLPKQFFSIDLADPDPCQGDVVELQADVPIIDADGNAAADESITYWLVLSNSCDMARSLDDVAFMAVAPMLPLNDAPQTLQESAQAYKPSRVFFVPSWGDDATPHIADLTRLVSVHRDALASRAQIRARMCFESWVLLNACLVRLLCRADERHL